MKPSLSYPLFFLCGAASSLFGSSASATVGQSVSFSVTAAGTTPFSFSWRKGGVAIPGATSNPFVIPSAVLADAGNYTAVVLNAAGSTTSDVGTLTVTAAAPTPAYAPDLSKSYAELSLSGSWTPTPNQFPDFPVVPLKKVTDVGSHWDDTSSTYLIAAGEAGVYEILITARTVDQPPPNVGVGLTAGIDSKDNKTLWQMTPANNGQYVHWGMQTTIRGSYAAGDKIRVNVFTQSSLTFVGFNATIRRLY